MLRAGKYVVGRSHMLGYGQAGP